MMRLPKMHPRTLLAVATLALVGVGLALVRPALTSAAAKISDDGRPENAALAKALGEEGRLTQATTLRVGRSNQGPVVQGMAANLYEQELVGIVARQANPQVIVDVALPPVPESAAALRATVDEALRASGAKGVSVSIDRGHVRLVSARIAEGLDAATEAVKKVPGVLVVDSGAQHLAGAAASTTYAGASTKAGAATTRSSSGRLAYDTTTEERVVGSTTERVSVTVPIPSVHLSVKNGEVTLTGEVASYAEKLAAEKAAQAIPGVTRVINKLTIPGQVSTTTTHAASETSFLSYLRESFWPWVLAGLVAGLFVGLAYAWWSTSEERDAVRTAVHSGSLDSFLKGLQSTRMDVLKLEQEDAGRVRHELAAKERALAALERQASTRQGLVTESDLELGRVRLQLGAREQDLSRLEAEIRSLEATLAEHNKKIAEIELGVAEKERTAREVEVTMASREPALTAATVDVDRLRAELASLRLRLESLTDRDRELHSAAQARAAQGAEFSALLKERDVAVKDLTAKLAEVRAKLEAKRREFQTERQHFVEIHDKRMDLALELTHLVSDIDLKESDLANLLTQLAERERRLAEARARVSTIEQEIETRKGEATTLKRRLESLDLRLVKIEAEQKEKLAALDGHIRTRKPEVKDLAKAVEKARSGRDKAQVHLAVARSARAERERDKIRLDLELHDAKAAAARARHDEEDTRKHLGEVETALARIESDVKEARAHATKQQNRFETVAATLTTDSKTHDELVDGCIAMIQRNAALASESENLTGRLNEVRGRTATAKDATQALRAELKLVAAEHKHTTTEVETVTATLSERRGELSASEKALAKLVTGIERALADRAVRDAEAAKLEASLQQLEHDLAARTSLLGETETRLHTVQGEVKTTNHTYEQLKRGLGELEERIKTLRSELKSAESEATSWSRKLSIERKAHDDLSKILAELLKRMEAAKGEMS